MIIDRLLQAIKNARRVLAALIPLLLDIGTAIAVINMIIKSIR